MPPQVVIQVLIAEVTLNDNQEFGVEIGLQSPIAVPARRSAGHQARQHDHAEFRRPGLQFNNVTNSAGAEQFAGESADGRLPGTLQSRRRPRVADVGRGRLRVLGIERAFSVLVRALKAQGRLDVLSRPQVT